MHILSRKIKSWNGGNKMKNLSKRIAIIYILLYFIISGFYCGINGSRICGEWDDYIYPTVTLMTQHKISISESDLSVIKEYFPEWAEMIDSIGIEKLSGRHTRNGGTLAWYFPTYALTCIPMICLLRFLGLPAIYAFCFTNLFAVMSVLLVTYKWLQINDKNKLVVIILLSINPVMFYYCWPSGEAVIYSFLAIGLIFWYNKWYKRAAVFVSLAGTLNTTIMSIGIIMIAEYVICLLQTKSKNITWGQFIKKNIRNVIEYGSCYIIGLIPMIYFYYNTGYINLTASYKSFIIGKETVLQKFIAYLFDLNFGILPYYPIILILGFILLIVAFMKKHWRYIEWFIAFIINILLYSIMRHINCGMSGMSRYNTWGVLILVFAVCLFFTELVDQTVIKKIVQTGLWLNAVILLLIVYNYGPTGSDKVSYVYWTPIAKYVMDHYPSIYNPLYSTFNSRTNHRDGGYNYETPIIYIADDGYVRKILASKASADDLRKSLVSEVNNEWLNEKINLLGGQDVYISIPAKYKVLQCEMYTIGCELSFYKESYNVQPYIVAGLSKTEEWGTWTLGNEFRMRFRTTSNARFLHGSIDCGVFNNEQVYTIYVNNEKVTSGVAIGEKIEFDFNNPGSENIIDIKIELPNAVSPESLGQSSDTRILALGMKSIIFTEK